jgi:hypothetical protein
MSGPDSFHAVVVIYRPWHLTDGRTLWVRVDAEYFASDPSERARRLRNIFGEPEQVRERNGEWMAFVYPNKWYMFFFREEIDVWE